MNILRNIYLAAAILCCALPLSAKLKPAPDPLIQDVGQVQGLTVNADNISLSKYYSDRQSLGNYAQTDFYVNCASNPVTLSDTRGLVVYFGRNYDFGAPTVVKVSGRPHGQSSYEDLGYAYLLFRGGKYQNWKQEPTHEFSNRVYGNGTYDSFKFRIIEVSSGNDAYYYKFNLFAIDDDQSYPGGRADPLRADDDYYYDFYDYEYLPNRGILNSKNHFGSNYEYPTEAPWGDNNTFVYHGQEYTLPTFTEQNGGQMPHVTEATVYAMPGDMISLSPYYDLPTSPNYFIRFAHWYNYVPRNADDELQGQQYGHVKDSRGNRLLDFLIDPSGVSLSRDYGYFAGSNFPTARWKFIEIGGEQYYVIANVTDLINFQYVASDANEAHNAIVVNDIDCKGKTIGRAAQESKYAYTAKFIGNGHTIKNFVINDASSTASTGFFGYVGSGAEIRDISLVDFSVSGGGQAGGLIGEIVAGQDAVKIENVFVNANVSSTQDAATCTGGIIGKIDSGAPAVSLTNVGFAGHVTGGSGDNCHNAALIGYADNSSVSITNCYAYANIDNYVDGQPAVGYNSAGTQVDVTNSYTFINPEDDTVGVYLTQTGFTSFEPATTEFNMTKSLFPGKHIICATGDWDKACVYMWGNAHDKDPYELFGSWPGGFMNNHNNYSSYIFLTDSQWETLIGHTDYWKIIFNNGGSLKTNDNNFANIPLDEYFEYNDFFYDNVYLKKSEWEHIKYSKPRTILLHNPDPYSTYTIFTDNGLWSGPINGLIEDKDSGESYAYFNIPENHNYGNFTIFENKEGISKAIVNEELRNTTAFVERGNWASTIRENLGWTESYKGFPVPDMKEVDLGDQVFTKDHTPEHLTRFYGAEATFYQPRNGEYAPDALENLSLEKPEYHIAADFAHEFNTDSKSRYNINYPGGQIHEPVLNFRHIFHVKDGKTFADENTTTKEDNEKYVTGNSRAVSARAGMDFQIRLTTQVPFYEDYSTYSFVKTNFYYKKSEGQYARVPRVALEITAPDGTVSYSEVRNGESIDKGQFFFDATANTQGSRTYPDTQNGIGIEGGDDPKNAPYQGGNGTGTVYRSLFCKGNDAKAGVYRVRLLAVESDGVTHIKTTDGRADLYLDEYVITFVSESEASVVNEETLATEAYRTHRSEYLEQEDVAGPPAVVVNFDEYRTFEEAPYKPDDYFGGYKKQGRYYRSYKWPVLWNLSTYSFGYGGYSGLDFNEYIVANHSSRVQYHLAADYHLNPDGTSGLYDRLYYDSYAEDPGKVKMGYFYYINAASDPGIMAKLMINNLCPGSTVAVSAWVAEMSFENEVANLSFNFVAVDENNNREIVHSFVTGYIDNINYGSHWSRISNSEKSPTSDNMADHGKWMHVYYSFIPDLSNIQNLAYIDHYELELENNCVSSLGADYAVDDIRAYIISPQLTAQQLEPICDANQNTVGIRISSRFDKILAANGLVESTDHNGVAPEDLPLHFAVLDKNKYDALYAQYCQDGSTLTKDDIVRQSIIYLSESNGDDAEKDYYATVTISTDFSSNSMMPYDTQIFGEAMTYTSPTTGIRYISTNILPYNEDLHPGSDYYIVLYAQYKDADGTMLPDPTYADFAITDDPCAKYAVIILQGSGVIKVDGIAYSDGQPIDVCAGQSPVVQVDLKMISEDEEINVPSYDDYVNAPNHYYDWYNGPLEDFMVRRDEIGSSYYDLLVTFRNGNEAQGIEPNIDAAELPEPAEGETDIFAPLRELIEQGTLVLHSSSFVFPPLEVENEDDNIVVLTAMPIIPGPDDQNGYKVCSQPNEIRLRVQDNAPLMFDGFAGIDYPSTDVPLRLGYRQLTAINSVDDITSAGSQNLSINTTVTIPEGAQYLELPLRSVTSYKGEGVAAKMTMAGNRNQAADPYVYLAETNDPRYIGLDKHPMDQFTIKNSLLPIGMVSDLVAETGSDDSYVTIVFSKQMEFREGYYYRVRFAYDEQLSTEVDGYCEGHVVFTIKVVPEYVKWTGASSRNWNNDANWSRVVADELLLPENDSKISDFTVTEDKKRVALIEDANGVVSAEVRDVPGNYAAYAPLDFTKAIIPDLSREYIDASAEETEMKPTQGYPYMFTDTKELFKTLGANGSYNWSQTADAPGAGDASKDIQYDLASLDMLAQKGKLACRPWYANTCEQIHFNHGAELVHQESFVFGTNYKKAWVDIEMTGDRWYTLGSPLQGVVAGDMYTKTVGGKQDNELFTDINFNNTDYGRFEPAVYQRGWNKAETKTYLLGDNSHDSKSSAVSLNWSRVYNDVDEDYAPGIGFSIRTDSEGIQDGGADNTVRFRLPKADAAYAYFDSSDQTEAADNTTVTRPGDRHSLTAFKNGKFETSVTVGTEGNYFLVGNPFIAHMKMDKFFEGNPSLENVYWIMTDGRQDATLWDEKSGTFISTDLTEDTNASIAPMQGFFVKSKDKTSRIDLLFTPDMIDEGAIDQPLKLKRMPTNEHQLITISALDADGYIVSRTIINVDPTARGAYDGAEDAALLLDRTLEERATVYTVASEQALALNSLDAIVETEVGLIASDDAISILLFEGIDDSEGLLLLDTATGEFADLYDGMTVEVKGSASGRFYITRSASDIAESTIAVVLNGRTVTIVSGIEGIVARVYTPAGLRMGEWSVDDASLQFDLEPGIFIVEALNDNQHITRKIIVK